MPSAMTVIPIYIATAGKVRLAHALTQAGGIRSEFTVTCLNEKHFYVVTPAWVERFDEDLLLKSCPEDGSVQIKNITANKGAFVITGPNSRELLSEIITQDLSQSSFPWFSAQAVDVGGIGKMLAIRVSYIGELGWELHHDIDQQLPCTTCCLKRVKLMHSHQSACVPLTRCGWRNPIVAGTLI